MQSVANNIVYSVQVAIAPDSTPTARSEASRYCNDFLQNSPPGELCEVGFILASHADPVVVRTGLQFIEHVAKFGWQVVPDREIVKERLFALMQGGLASGAPGFMQEALTRVIVEIAKREWPQLWPNLFPRLFEMANSSDLALLVLRRMVEDVATLQTVDCQERRRELSQSLHAIVPEVISTFFRVLVDSVKQYHATTEQIYQRRAKICLGCLLPYIEWTNPAIFLNDKMIPTMFSLLPDFYFQMNAAECVLQLVERKPQKKEDRLDIPAVCLSDECFLHFLQAAVTAQPNNGDLLRKLGDVLIALAPNTTVGKMKVDNFLQGCEKLAGREEAVAVLGSASAINQFLKVFEKENAQQVPVGFTAELDKFLIRLLNLILQKFVAAPPKSLEREEMTKLKNEFSTLLRTVGRRVPCFYKEVNSWLRNSLNSANSVQNFQWEALTLVVDAVASSVSQDDAEMVKVGLMDLESCHAKFVSEQSLELKSLILSIISALFVFLDLSKKRGDFGEAHLRMMIAILETALNCFKYEDESLPARDLRRHASALLIKLGQKYPELMALGFDIIHSFASAYAPKLSTMEYNNVIESLFLISNTWENFAKQSAFIGSLFNPNDWQQISAIVDNAQSFSSIIPEDIFLDKRSLLLRNLHTVLSGLRRVKKIPVNKNALNGNGMLSNGASENGAGGGGSGDKEISLHPSYDHICPVIPVILKLVKTLHSFFETPELSYTLELSDAERTTILGLYGHFHEAVNVDAEKDKTHRDKVKVFVLNLIELSYGILGECGPNFGSQFYNIPQLSSAYLGYVGYNLQLLNDFRLRFVIRNVFKSFLLDCPTTAAMNVVVPFAQQFFPFMAERLHTRWTVIETAKYSETEGEEEKEVLENSCFRLLTKDYVELLGRLLEKRSSSSETPSASDNNGPIADVEMHGGGEPPNASNTSHSSDLGEIGIMILSDPICFTAIINCVVACLCWDDSQACLRASRCILMIWDRILPQVDVMRGTFTTTLRAVCLWEESEANLELLFRIADTSFRSYYGTDPQFIQILKDWGAPEVDIQKLIGLCQGPKNEKKRKDVWRKLLHNNPALEKNKSPKSQWLKGLPQLKINGDKSSDRQRSPEIDLKECFSLIHHK